MLGPPLYSAFFFFNDTATTEIYTLSLHDALPISARLPCGRRSCATPARAQHTASRVDLFGNCAKRGACPRCADPVVCQRSEEHTSELQSPCNLVCRLLLEKKKILSDVVCTCLLIH